MGESRYFFPYHMSFNKPRMKRHQARADKLFTIKLKTSGLEHHNDNSHYYFDYRLKGIKCLYIHGTGIINIKTNNYVKIFTDKTLGWANN